VPRARLAYVSAAHYGERTVSDDFAWRPATSPRATSPRLRVTVVLACAGVGLVAGSLHPINKLITAFEPASHPHVTAKANLAASAAITEIAKREGRKAAEVAYDIMIEDGGQNFIYFPVQGYARYDMSTPEELLADHNTIMDLATAARTSASSSTPVSGAGC
jgi:hypothetical protein